MKIFVFDTETTGFINKKDPNLDNQPQIIQFAGILGDIEKNEQTGIYNFKEEKRVDILINPEKPIPFGSSQVHHLYDIDVKDKQNFEKQYSEIINLINNPDIIVGHNIEYDENMTKLELRRLEKEYEYKPKQVVCTMNESITYCKLPKRDEKAKGFKRPKLGELHKVLFKEYFTGAHDAMVDVEATLKCFIELVNLKVIKIEKKEENVMSLF
ncbi:MAG: 3'-5' exonuclease [Candidatus Gracilibacteria bacterium]|nr:3'-5' exonuclease [Candidatus Gracilibacteria bacterium]MDQ7022777.1 3'-5' exonuclease [Candidatus Gracilibacteria bacterium]